MYFQMKTVKNFKFYERVLNETKLTNYFTICFMDFVITSVFDEARMLTQLKKSNDVRYRRILQEKLLLTFKSL